jgi:hypothetical protein
LIGVIISGSAGSSGEFGSFLLLAFTTAILVVLSLFLKKRNKELAKIYPE